MYAPARQIAPMTRTIIWTRSHRALASTNGLFIVNALARVNANAVRVSGVDLSSTGGGTVPARGHHVYVLDPYRLMDTLNSLPDTAQTEQRWAEHIKTHPEDSEEDESDVYLPSGGGDERPFELPRVPLVLQFPFISRRVAAQRSQFTVFGTEPTWLSDEAAETDSAIRCITIDGTRTRAIRAELRECGSLNPSSSPIWTAWVEN